MSRILILACCLAGFAAPAAAHTLMTDPLPRNDNDGLKTGPCGNVAPTDTPHELVAGSTIIVDWFETVDHPGYYRIAFSHAGDAEFDDNVLLDNIPDVLCSELPCAYSAEVTLPDEECADCALQLIQYMGNAPPYSLYYSCADIALVAAPEPDAGPTPDAGDDAPDAGPVGDDSGVGGGGATMGPVAGGCRASGAGTGSDLALIGLAFIALAAGRRRRA